MDIDAFNINDTTFYKRVNNIGSTTYVNVTDGTSQTVPWGVLDWWHVFTGNILGWGVLAAIVYSFVKVFTHVPASPFH